jgi:hypothetical protein
MKQQGNSKREPHPDFIRMGLNIKKKNFWADEIFKNLSFVANK